jgi:hypothetical protein
VDREGWRDGMRWTERVGGMECGGQRGLEGWNEVDREGRRDGMRWTERVGGME